MYCLNKAQVIGNLTRDPELKEIPSGQQLCTFGVATNRRWKNQSTGEMQEDVEFHNMVCWGKLAEIAGQYLKKGQKVFVEGRLSTRNWEDDAGIKHYRTEIVANDLIMLSSGRGVENSEVPPASAPAAKSDEKEVPAEDLPF